MKNTICLCMIVKDESHIIEHTLTHLLKYIKFDYWVIVDTGSTDNTIEIINNFFLKQCIPGKVYETPWKDFGFNRTDAFEKAFNLTDYVFVWDADDSISGKFSLPDILTADSYSFIFGNDNGFRYNRCQLFNNRKKWKYVGVLHEYPACIEQCGQEKDIIGDYYFISGRSGARNKDPNKYLRDAEILEKAFFEAVEKNDEIKNRYAFYCAQSYNSANMKVTAIEWYKKVLTLNTWHQEKYISCLEIYNLCEALDKVYDGLPYLVESYKYDKHRIECFYRLIKYYCIHDLPEISNMYYEKIKNCFEDNYSIENQPKKLFLRQDEYVFYLPYYMIIIGCRIKNYELVGKMYEIIFKYRFVGVSEWWIHNLFHNIQFSIEQLPFNAEFIQNMFSYIHSLGLKNITLNDTHNKIINKIIDRYRPLFADSTNVTNLINQIKPKEQITVLFSITTCKRLDLFKKTMYSILNNWLDIDKIDYFLCVDDNSSEEDRTEMKTLFPFFNYIMKNPEERGHRESMNIIWLELQKLKPTFWIHMEDDWMFFQKENYVTKGIQFLDKYETMRINQIVFNKTYGLMYSDLDRVGGIELEKGLILHEKRDGLVGKNCAYWPHYSLQPSITRTNVILELGNYNSENKFFERDYANKYYANNYKTAFFPSIYSLHIGKQHWETEGKNAYALNEIKQFNGNIESKKNNTITKEDNSIVYNGYSNVFDTAIKHFNESDDKNTLLKSFRSQYTIYGFTENGDNPPDEEAISIAKEINIDMYEGYLDLLKGRAIVGYDGSTTKYAHYNNLDSRHIMMSILLFSSLCKPLKTIVEVGGGYGNWLYLNRTKKFNKWIIIDLPHVGELQKYYLTNTNVNLDNVQFVSAFDYKQVESEDIDLLIGAHSLSEVSFDIFSDYFKCIISKSKYFFYCYHKFRPSLKLIDAKIKMINTQFILVNSVMSENGNVNNCLYINKEDSKTNNICNNSSSNTNTTLSNTDNTVSSIILNKNGTMREHLECILNKINLGESFGLIRPSDGEHSIMLGDTITNCDNWTFKKGGKLQEMLLFAVKIQLPNLYIGIPCNTCNKPWNCTPTIYKNFIEKFQVPLSQRTYANIFSNSNWKTFIDFLKSYKNGFHLITSGTKETDELNIKSRHIIDSKLVDKWDSQGYKETESVLKYIYDKKGELILFSAGPLSKIWIPMCLKSNPSNIYLDVGGSIDLFTKGISNRFYTNNNHPFTKEACRFDDISTNYNIELTSNNNELTSNKDNNSIIHKNLIYMCAFGTEEYYKLLELTLISIRLFSNYNDVDFLVFLSKEFEEKVIKLSKNLQIPIKIIIINNINNGHDASSHKLHIFNYIDDKIYFKILYIDIDIIVQGNLLQLFDLCIEDKLYAARENKINNESFGKKFFNFSKINPETSAFNAGVLLFHNSKLMRTLFNNVNEHINEIKLSGSILPPCYEQPFLNFHSINNNLYDNEILNSYIHILLKPNNSISPITNKSILINHYIGSSGINKLKQESYHMSHLLDSYNNIIAPKTMDPYIFFRKQYNWGNGRIIFETNNTLITTWTRKGTYEILNTYIVKVSWSKFDHIIIFNNDYTEFTSIRISDIIIHNHTIDTSIQDTIQNISDIIPVLSENISENLTNSKNLLYFCVFYNRGYFELLDILLRSLLKNSDLTNIDLLVFTSKDLEVEVVNLSNKFNIPILVHIFDFNTQHEAGCARLFIFDFPKINEYKTFLYMDTDIVVDGDISKLFTLDIEEKVYAKKEYSIGGEGHGGWFFDFNTIDEKKDAINSGILLFPNSEKIRRVFNTIRCHIDTLKKAQSLLPLCMDQSFIIYHLFKNNLYNNELLNPFIFLAQFNDPPILNDNSLLLSHFVWPIGNTNHKKNRMLTHISKVFKVPQNKVNLVYACVFYNKDYIKLLELLLLSMKIYSSIDNIEILILTSSKFKDELNNISKNIDIKINIMCVDLSTIFEAACARLLIFDYPNLYKYENILYLDTDIIIKGDLSPLFNLIKDEKLYALEQGTIQSLHFGQQFFESVDIDQTITGINSGTLLFKNCSTIKDLFCRIRNHVDVFTKTGDPIPYTMDQPFINYHAIKDSLYNNNALNPYVSLYENVDTVYNYDTSVICHFSFPIGNFNHKYYRMKNFLVDLLNIDTTKITPSKIDNIITNMEKQIIGTQLSWGNGYIKFMESYLETTWGKGIYYFKSSDVVCVNWNGYNHIVKFFNDYNNYLSIRIKPNDLVYNFDKTIFKDTIKSIQQKNVDTLYFDNRNEMIKELVPKCGSYVEIGIFTGEFSKILNEILSPSKLVLLDLFSGSGYSGDQHGNNIITCNLEDTYNNLIEYSKSYPYILPLKGDSSLKLNEFDDNTFDMIYIDGDHSYEGCRRDLEAAFKKIKYGGWIMGHDYEMNMKKANTVWEFGVKKAVDEFCLKYNQTIHAKALDGCVSYAIKIVKK